MSRLMLGCVKEYAWRKYTKLSKGQIGETLPVSDTEKELISLIYNDLLQLNKKTGNLNEKIIREHK